MSNPFGHVGIAGGGGTQSSATTSTSSTGGGINFNAVRSDVSAGMAGRISLAMLDLLILGMIAFYIWTRNAQGGS